MTILICGSRDWVDYETILLQLFALTFFTPSSEITVIDGLAWGADNLGHKAARALGYKTRRFPADWARYNIYAGPIRNQQMLDEGDPDLVLAFPLANSRGTADMVYRAKKAGIEVVIQ